MNGIRFNFHGRFDVPSFQAFAVHRAGRLGLGLIIGACDCDSCEMTVIGQDVLVDAFEMAMSLGPIDCIVLHIERYRLPESEVAA